jgi:hypothetical protein
LEKYSFLLTLFLIGTFFSCSKDKSYEPLEILYQAERSANDNTLINDKIAYKDIIGYDTTNYTFLIDSTVIRKIRNYFFPSAGLPFTVNVDGEIIYRGMFFPSYSNSLQDGLIIDPEESLIGNKLTVRKETGWCATALPSEDLRNDKRIIAVLQRDHKLIKIVT